MLTLTIKIKEGKEQVGIQWNTRGTDKATLKEKEQLACILMGINLYNKFLEEKVSGYNSVWGTTQAAREIVQKRWKNM